MLSPSSLFYIISLSLLFSSFSIIVSNHTIFSLLFLVVSFILTSFLLFLLECEFLALMFIIIYVGAIAVLFLFSVMMLEFKLNNLKKNSFFYLPVSVFFAIFFVAPIVYEILMQFDTNPYPNTFFMTNYYQNWYDLIDSVSDIETYGQVLYTYFVLQFLVVGLILLMVVIGVVYLMNNLTGSKSNYQSVFKQTSRNSKFFS